MLRIKKKKNSSAVFHPISGCYKLSKQVNASKHVMQASLNTYVCMYGHGRGPRQAGRDITCLS